MSIAEKALLVDVHFKKVGKSKQDKIEATNIASNTGSNPEMWNVTKKLWPEHSGSPLDKIRKIEVSTRAWHKVHTLPWSDEGARILTANLFDRYRDYMRQVKSDHKKFVKEFGTNYPDLLLECQKELNGKFNPDEYPSAENVMGRFKFWWDYNPVPKADDFRVTLADEDMQELRQQLDEAEQRAEQNMKNDILERIAGPLSHIFGLLDEGKTFKKNSFENLVKALDLVQELDISGSQALVDACFEIKSQVCFAPDLIRDNEVVHNMARDNAKKHLDNLNSIFG